MRLLLIEFNYKAESRASTLFTNYERRRSKQKHFLRTKKQFPQITFFAFLAVLCPNFLENSAKNLFWDFFCLFLLCRTFFANPPLQETNGFSYLLCDSPPFCMVWQTHPSFPRHEMSIFFSFSPLFPCFFSIFPVLPLRRFRPEW